MTVKLLWHTQSCIKRSRNVSTSVFSPESCIWRCIRTAVSSPSPASRCSAAVSTPARRWSAEEATIERGNSNRASKSSDAATQIRHKTHLFRIRPDAFHEVRLRLSQRLHQLVQRHLHHRHNTDSVPVLQIRHRVSVKRVRSSRWTERWCWAASSSCAGAAGIWLCGRGASGSSDTSEISRPAGAADTQITFMTDHVTELACICEHAKNTELKWALCTRTAFE